MIDIVREVCERKVAERRHPPLATELELKQELSRRGVNYTAESFRLMLAPLANHPRIVCYRTLNHDAYAYIAEVTTQDLSPREGDTGATTPRQQSILSESAVEKGAQEIPGATPSLCRVSEEWEDNSSDGGRSYQDDQYWWSSL